MVGQEKLLNKINSYTIDTFPRSAIFVGEKGCGKHTLINYISENILKLPILDITDMLSSELIDNIYRNSNPNIYLIDLSKLTEKEQNIILKFVEEPLNNSFIFLLCEDKNFVLETVLNRCIPFEFSIYSFEELKAFINTDTDIEKDIITNVLRTPGNILTTNLNILPELKELCIKIINNLNKAGIYNVLAINNKINFKDEYDKYPPELFLNMLIYFVYFQFIKTNNKNMLDMYKTLENQRKSLLDQRINKELLFENLFIKLWKGEHYGY